AKVANFIAENPCCDKSEFASDPETEKHLAWLVSTGHVVSFTNGVYSQVEKYPKYGPQWRKRKAEKKEAAPQAAEPEVPAAPQTEEVTAQGENLQNKEATENETAPQLAE
ncbi:MAG: hypothetical protein IKZ22_10025, partial [Kiritimatiellae bacterium]|nr:hypothetical protein [Kiritimatiellia bacterium]